MPKTDPKLNLKDQPKDPILKNITEHLPGMVYRLQNNAHWDTLYLSQGAYELTGYTAEELMGEDGPTLASLIVAEDYERVRQEAQRIIKQEQPFEIIHRINTKSGEQKWVMAKGQVKYTVEYYSNPETTIPELIVEGILLDINKQKQAEIALQNSEKRFRRIVDGSIEGILIHRNWQPLFINKSLVKMLGYNSHEQIFNLDSISSIIAPHERKRMISYSQTRLDGEKAPNNYEFEALHRDGSIRCLEVESSLMDWKGEPAILSTLVDSTEKKRAIMEVEDQRQQLAHINRLNTFGEMSAGIAHELNQPLTAIVNRCAAARNRINSEKPDLDKIKEALISIEEQAQRSGDIIENMREMVKSKQSKKQTIDIAEIINFCINIIKTEGFFKYTAISTNIAENLPNVMGDPIQIQQVVLNLIHNSKDAMQGLNANERNLTISAIKHDDHAIQVSVSDCGTGISEEVESALYQSFFSTKEDGMGMGLSICRTIITAHKGLIWFSRNAQQGVTFRFTLPLI